jgi:hypothetical protein
MIPMSRLASLLAGSIRLALLGLAFSLTACPVLAQEAIPTAPRASASPLTDAAGADSDTLRLSDHVDEGPGFLRPAGPCGGPAKTADGKADKSPHGEVWAGVGTRGYREIGGAVCVPVGDSSAVTIAVDTGQIDGWNRRH